MSDKKFNLKTYQKINGDEHIDMRLEQDRKDPPDVINEKQLESYRGTESDVTIEKMLENKRTGEETEITEKRLDTHKAKFANKYRNPGVHEGDMNKLEEQRLMGDPAEKEKYIPASETPKQFRWWEDVKSPDDLKVAQDETKKSIVAAKKKDEFDEPVEHIEELKFDKPRWQDVTEEDEQLVDKDFPIDTIEDFNVSTNIPREVYIKKEKYLSNPKDPDLSGVYMILAFDPDGFMGNESDIRRAALEKVLTVRPELSGLISEDSFGSINEGIDEGTITLRVTGPEFANIGKTELAPSAIPSTAPSAEVDSEEQPIEEVSYEEKNIEGTPMAMGVIGVNINVTPENRDSVVKDVISFVRDRHPNIHVEEDSLDLSDLERGEARFMVGVMGSELTELTADSDFEIIVESASKKK